MHVCMLVLKWCKSPPRVIILCRSLEPRFCSRVSRTGKSYLDGRMSNVRAAVTATAGDHYSGTGYWTTPCVHNARVAVRFRSEYTVGTVRGGWPVTSRHYSRHPIIADCARHRRKAMHVAGATSIWQTVFFFIPPDTWPPNFPIFIELCYVIVYYVSVIRWVNILMPFWKTRVSVDKKKKKIRKSYIRDMWKGNDRVFWIWPDTTETFVSHRNSRDVEASASKLRRQARAQNKCRGFSPTVKEINKDIKYYSM